MHKLFQPVHYILSSTKIVGLSEIVSEIAILCKHHKIRFSALSSEFRVHTHD